LELTLSAAVSDRFGDPDVPAAELAPPDRDPFRHAPTAETEPDRQPAVDDGVAAMERLRTPFRVDRTDA